MAEGLALPGFHIFEFDGRCQNSDEPASRAHFDLQWMHAVPGRSLQGTLSFTVALEQPTGAAAMQIWPLRYQQIATLAVPLPNYALTHGSRRVADTDGSITIHDGHILHAIGNGERSDPRGGGSPSRGTGR